MKNITTEYRCEICGQFGNNPHFYNGRALCKFHRDLMVDKDKAVIQRRGEKAFKRMMAKISR